MESPPGEEALVKAPENDSSPAALKENSSSSSLVQETERQASQVLEATLNQDATPLLNGCNGFEVIDYLGRLSPSNNNPTSPSERSAEINPDMGNYVSRSSSEEDLRLDEDPATSSGSSSSSSNKSKESETSCSSQTNTSSSLEASTAASAEAALSTPPRRRAPLPSATGAPDFQPIGAEVSAEKARQLKKEIRRLSPIHVSQRERTLAEISLTTSAPGDEPAPSSESSGTVSDTKTAIKADREEVARSEDSQRLSDSNSNGSKGRELVLKLSRVDSRSPTRIEESSALLDATCSEVAAAKSTDTTTGSSRPAEPCPFGTSLILERCDQGNDELPSSKAIVEKLHIGNEVEFSSPVQQTGSSARKRLLSPPPPILFDPEDDNEPADSSEVLASMAAAAASSMGILCEDGLTQAIISRLDRPEPFTDDSAESLTLVAAAAARDEVRSDGSDSGLGGEITGDAGPAPAHESDSDTFFLDRIPDDILTDKEKVVDQVDGFELKGPPIMLPNFSAKPIKSSLKRRLTTDCLDDGDDQPADKRSCSLEDDAVAGTTAPKKKRNITFDAVTVYYFPRAQGFTCVPSQGGSTLGMSATHTHAERFTLTEHAQEQRLLHRARLAQLRVQRATERNNSAEQASSSEDPSDDTDEERSSDTDHSPDNDCYYFLQPVPTWQRRQLLRAAGVRRIDSLEKDECRDIRASREHCGCACKGYCDPESCPCSRANVKCQVDRAGFPCGCTRDGCANSTGRIEFNPMRVRTHFIHTLMRLKMEKKPVAHSRDVEEQHQESHHHHHHHQSRMSMPSLDSNNDCLGGGFTSLHYDLQDGNRTNSLDLYTIREDCYSTEDCLVNDRTQNQRKINNEFGQNYQQYGTSGSNIGFPQNSYTDYQNYQPIPSTSRSPFQPQFQPVTTNPGFSHYSYTQDTGSSSSSNACNQGHSLIQHQQQLQQQQQQQQQQQHNSSGIYESPFTQDEITGSQYTNLNPMSSAGKLEPFSELLSARYSYYGDLLEQQPQQQSNQQQQQCLGAYQINGAKLDIEKTELNINDQQEQLDEEDCDENFGEIIKKSMVETVSA